jgi:hypothetical protein
MTPEDKAKLEVAARMRAEVDGVSSALDRLARKNEEEWARGTWKRANRFFMLEHAISLITVGAGWAIMTLMTDKNDGQKLIVGCLGSLAILAIAAVSSGWQAVRFDRGFKPKSFGFWTRNAYIVGSLGGGVTAAANIGAIFGAANLMAAKDNSDDLRSLQDLGWHLWSACTASAAGTFAVLYGCGALVSYMLFHASSSQHSTPSGAHAEPGAAPDGC